MTLTRLRLYLTLFLLLPMLAAGRELPFLEARVVPEQPYVQAQLQLTLRLFRESHLQRGDFLLPEIPGVLLEFVQEDEPRPADYQGQALEMIEQRYLLFPQRSGPLQLPAPIFSGHELFIKGEPITLQVRPPPEAASLPWLPIREIQLARHWVDEPGDWRVGEPRIRRLSIQARGLTAAQLPALTVPEPDGIEIQSLRVERRDEIINGELIGTSELYQRLIPTRQGDYRLESPIIHWWNTDSDQPGTAILDAELLTILPPLLTATVTRSGTPLSLPSDARAVERRDAVPASLIGLSITLLLLLTAGWRLLPSARRLARRWWQCRRALRQFYRACAGGEPRTAADALLAWVSADGVKACNTLPELADRMESLAARQAVLKLDQTLYGRSPGDWEGMKMLQVIGSERNGIPWRRRRGIIQEIIPPLNP